MMIEERMEKIQEFAKFSETQRVRQFSQHCLV